MSTARQKRKTKKSSKYLQTRKVQTGGYILESENEFFDWLNKDENIERLLKSSLRLMEHKKKTVQKLLDSEKAQLKEIYATNLKVTAKGLTDMGEYEGLGTKSVPSQQYSLVKGLIGKINSNVEGKQVNDLAKNVNTILVSIGSIELLGALYDRRKNEICTEIFNKKLNPDLYKEALAKRREAILTRVNAFLEEFTGESNRRHRLFILNYAIDFAENWSSFQDNYKLNIILTGGAGLGKTTFAKAIGPLFYEFGLLAKPTVKVREKRDFIAEYVGQTQAQTYATLYSGMEEVIFIDEAYSVSGCGKSHGHDYGQEFIDALVDVTQKSRGLFSIIAAGYKSEMHHCFLDKNPGMRRRFPNELELKPYSVLDLDNIMLSGILKKFFFKELTNVYLLDLLKEPQIYFTSPKKLADFYDEMRKRSLAFESEKQLPEAKEPAAQLAALEKAKSQIPGYDMMTRYRSRVIGFYRFFLFLSAFDTRYNSFGELFASHMNIWKLIVGDTQKSYKFNLYRLLALIYMSNHQQKREILKSYILRTMFSEKEGSLYPNQAGDMGTLSTFILAEPNVNENIVTQPLSAINIFNNYFVTRGGSKFSLEAQKKGEATELFIYYIGGGFTNHRDFEKSVIEPLLTSIVGEGEDVNSLWKLGTIPEDKRRKIVANLNKLYSTAVTSLHADAERSLKSSDPTEAAEKRLPSGVDARFLDAELRSYKALVEKEDGKFGDESKQKFLSYVATDDYDTDENPQSVVLLNSFLEDAGAQKILVELNAEDFCGKPTYIKSKEELVAEAKEQGYEVDPNNPYIPLGLPPLRRTNTSFGPGVAPFFGRSPSGTGTLNANNIVPTAHTLRRTNTYLPPPVPPGPSILYYIGNIPEAFYDFVGKDLLTTLTERKAKWTISYYIPRPDPSSRLTKNVTAQRLFDATDSLYPSKYGYHLFGITAKTKRGDEQTLMYRLHKSREIDDLPSEVVEVAGDPRMTPWEFIFLGPVNSYMEAGYPVDTGIEMKEGMPRFLYYVHEAINPPTLATYEDLKMKSLRVRPQWFRKPGYKITDLATPPVGMEFGGGKYFTVVDILKISRKGTYRLKVENPAAKITNLPTPTPEAPFVFELVKGPDVKPPTGFIAPSTLIAGLPAPPPGVPGLGLRRTNTLQGTPPANSPSLLPPSNLLPPPIDPVYPDVLYFMGSKKKSTGIGLAQEAINLKGEFLEVSPRVKDQEYKITMGPYEYVDQASAIYQMVQVQKVGVPTPRYYILDGSKNVGIENFPPASGSSPWKFTLKP